MAEEMVETTVFVDRVDRNIYRERQVSDIGDDDSMETNVSGDSVGRRERASIWLRKLLPSPDIVFISQMVIIYVVIGVSLFNLTSGNGDGYNGKLWIALLSSCIGYMLPNPKLETRLPLYQQ